MANDSGSSNQLANRQVLDWREKVRIHRLISRAREGLTGLAEVWYRHIL